jgi:hypothetical protein
MRKLKKEEFINRAKEIHNDYYDYSLVEYVGANKKIKIVCPIHGIFEQTPCEHTNLKHGCVLCNRKVIDINSFIKRSNELHKNKYDYSLVEYKGPVKKVKIICPEHGIFEQTPKNHLTGYGCILCANENKMYSKEEFIDKVKEIHEYKYDYSLLDYQGVFKKVKIICTEHGVFEQTANDHLNGCGCKKCGIKTIRLKHIEIIKKNKNNGYQLTPSFNEKACELFESIMKEKNCHINHAMNGGEFYIKELGFWLDGYDKENNVAYEYDENHHFDKKGNLREKDIRRQQR